MAPDMASGDASTQPVASAETPLEQPLVAEQATVIEIEQPPVDLWGRIGRELSWQSMNNASVDKAREAFLNQPDHSL